MDFFDGFFFALGALVAYILVSLICALFILPDRDDTDPPNKRSGLKLLIDHKTGCHYLVHKGGLTPRLDSDGKQICDKR